MKSILDVILLCASCHKRCRLGDAIPCVNDGSGFGCPVPDCGGFLIDDHGAIGPADVVIAQG
jgi:hypothetical protein